MERGSGLIENEQSAQNELESSPVKAIEEEMREIRRELTSLRFEGPSNNVIQNWEMVRLMEVHNSLDLEVQRLHEEHMKKLVFDLKLDDIGAVGYIKRGAMCSIEQKVSGRKNRAVTFILPNQRKDSFMMALPPKRAPEESIGQSHDIRKQMIAQLIDIERKKDKTPAEEQRKTQIMDALKAMQSRFK